LRSGSADYDGLEHVEQRPRGELGRLPEPALPKPAERFDGVGALHERECAAVFEEAAKPDAPGAAHLDERELRHRVVGHGPFDDRDLARPVEYSPRRTSPPRRRP